MTVQDEIRQRIEKDVLLARLRRKIDTGKADFNDTFLYSDRAGKLLGEIFSRRLQDIPLEEREALCVELLRDRYTDINQLIDRVQRVLDEAQNLHIAPQHAPFKNERAHKIGNATADPTVPVETQQRRAESAPATMTRAMHDDRMKKEADFRSRAGLQCYITRKTDGKCCEWCDKMAGRYEYHSEPKDIYRRHDNCGCSVTYENGRQRQDVWSKREWEAPEPGAGAGDPVVFTKEQAMQIQQEKQLPRMAPGEVVNNHLNILTNGEVRGTIRAITVDDFELRTYGKGVMEEVEKAIFSGIQLAEKRSGAIVSDILISHIPPTKAGREAILTEIMPNGLLRMTFNEDVFSGLSLDDINAIFNGTESILANSLEEAMIHESGHLKYMTGKKPSEVEKIHSELAKEHIKGISKYAEKDGAECIAEVEVMLYRGEDVPEDAMKLYRRYIKGA